LCSLVFQDKVIEEYKYFLEKVQVNLEKFIIEPNRNYRVPKHKNSNLIFKMMMHEAGKGDVGPLNALGFCYTYGLMLDERKDLALKYFKQAALQNNQHAIYACYYLEKHQKEANKYFGSGLAQLHPRAIGQLAGLISSNSFSSKSLLNVVIANLFKFSAEKGVPISMNNYAECLAH